MRHPHKYERSLWATYIFTVSKTSWPLPRLCANEWSTTVFPGLFNGRSRLDDVREDDSRWSYGEHTDDGGVSAVLVYLHDNFYRYNPPHKSASQVSLACFPCLCVLDSRSLTVRSCRPLVATIEVLCGLEPRVELSTNRTDREIFVRQTLRTLIRILVVAVIVVMAIVFPSFDRIMALMGSALCFTICIILPLAFYLKIFGKEINPKERILDWSLLIVSSVLAVIGTVWAFLPQETIVSV